MNPTEIQELLDLNDWSRTKLAAELEVTEGAVCYWLQGKRLPGGPAVILMRLWLEQARGEKSKRRRTLAVAR